MMRLLPGGSATTPTTTIPPAIAAVPRLGEAIGPAAVPAIQSRPGLRLDDAAPRPALRGRRDTGSSRAGSSAWRGQAPLRQPALMALLAMINADPAGFSDDDSILDRRPRQVLRAYRQAGAECERCGGAFTARA
jgi:hypothetical protein